MDEELAQKFKEVDTSPFPNFEHYDKPLEMSLLVLWIAKEKIGIKKMTADDIAMLIRDVYETSIDAKAILRAFSRAGNKVHTYKETVNGTTHHYYEIMRHGKDHLISLLKEGAVDVVYFEPNKRFTSRRLLAKNVLDTLSGDLMIVDPFCGTTTLDLLNNIKDKKIYFLTKTEKLQEPSRSHFLRELKDFKLENDHAEFRNYPHDDLHDRYILSSDSLVIIGHSIKDLGAKESFAIILKKKDNVNIVEAVIENFDRRWKQSTLL
jgi:hypothetical protein